jgi:hypothetical protein
MEMFTLLKKSSLQQVYKKRNTQTTRLKKGFGDSTKYMHHTNNKAIKSQNRNKYTTDLFPKHGMSF